MDLLDLYKKISEKDDKLIEVIGDTDLLGEILDDISDTIMDSYGLPVDNTTEYEDLSQADENMFCRDYWFGLIFDFGRGEIKKEKVVKELKNWKTLPAK